MRRMCWLLEVRRFIRLKEEIKRVATILKIDPRLTKIGL
jgi:hypothetical protein